MATTTTTSKKQPSYTTYRVTGLSAELSSDQVRLLLQSLNDIADPIDIRSLGSSAYDHNTQIATITLSAPLDGGPRWEFTVASENGEHEQISLDTVFDGLTGLNHVDPEAHIVDIIALSGLGSHALGSFKERNKDYVWLRDRLPKDLSNRARIFIYGHDTKVEDSDSFQQLEDLGGLFRQHLYAFTNHNKEFRGSPRKLFFIAHSLGGLVFKQALVQMREYNEPDDEDILASIIGAMFFGVPSQGMNIESLIPMANTTNMSFLHSLDASSKFLRELNRKLSELFDPKIFEIRCFYETMLSPTAIKDSSGRWSMTGEKKRLVGESSASQGLGRDLDAKYCQGLLRNHADLVKFSRHSTDYQIVKSNIKRSIASISSLPGSGFPRRAEIENVEAPRKLCEEPMLNGIGHQISVKALADELSNYDIAEKKDTPRRIKSSLWKRYTNLPIYGDRPSFGITEDNLLVSSSWKPSRVIVDVYNLDTKEHLPSQTEKSQQPPIISQNGGRIACMDTDANVKLWKISHDRRQETLHIVTGARYKSRNMFLPDGQLIILNERAPELSDEHTWETLSKHDYKIVTAASGLYRTEMAFSPNGKFAAIVVGKPFTVRYKTAIIILELSTGRPAISLSTTLEYNGFDHGTLAYSPDGRFIASARKTVEKYAVEVWDTSRGGQSIQLDYNHDSLVALAFASDGTALAVGAESGRIVKWRTDTWTPDGVCEGPESLFQIQYSSDGKYIVAGGKKNFVVWRIKRNEEPESSGS